MDEYQIFFMKILFVGVVILVVMSMNYLLGNDPLFLLIIGVVVGIIYTINKFRGQSDEF